MERESQLRPAKVVDTITDHRIDMLLLAILFVGFFSCLIRPDYNFVMAFFCYFVWQQRKDLIGLKLSAAVVIACIGMDIIFAITEIPVWMSSDPQNEIWSTLRPMHNFGVFCFVLINLIKILLLVFVFKGIAQGRQSLERRSA